MNLRDVVTKLKCEEDHLFFTRYFFKRRQSIKFIVNWHHRLVADTVDRVIKGELKNVCINVSPGGTKTELVVINLIARGLALNPRARFLHLSGSDTLASLNSSTAREIVLSEEYQRFWNRKIATDTNSKKRWNVLVDGQEAGGVYATSIGGQVVGFRAGHMAPGFQGAILIDDPIKPEDAFSRTALEEANRMLITTVKSRKANPATPIVLIMQRIAENDCTGFIEGGNLGADWTIIKIPAVLNEEYVETLSEKYKKLIPPPPPEETVEGRFSYWPYKEPLPQLLDMEKGGGKDKNGQRISRHVFASQYNQSPKALGGNIIHGNEFRRYRFDSPPRIKYRKIFADTAQKTKESNDYSVFEEWGYGHDGYIYLLDLIRGRWESPDLIKTAVAFWAKAKSRQLHHFGRLTELMVEDKSSGTGLIQTLKLPPYNIPIKGIERDKDKLMRVNDITADIQAGQVWIPEDAPFTLDFVTECESFTANDSHDFDDQVDPLVDAVNDMLGSGNKLKQWIALGKRGTEAEKPITHLPPEVERLRKNLGAKLEPKEQTAI